VEDSVATLNQIGGKFKKDREVLDFNYDDIIVMSPDDGLTVAIAGGSPHNMEEKGGTAILVGKDERIMAKQGKSHC
jgi:hypothetical protein